MNSAADDQSMSVNHALDLAREHCPEAEAVLRDALTERDLTMAVKDDQLAELQRLIDSKDRQMAALKQQLEELLRARFGRKSEKVHPDQLWLDDLVKEALAASEEALAGHDAGEDALPDSLPPDSESESGAGTGRENKSRRNGRVAIPDWIERRTVMVDVCDEEKTDPQTGEELPITGYERTEKLNVVRSRLEVIEYLRPKYGPAERADGSTVIVIAELPAFPLGSSKADAGMIADVVISKIDDHLPLYRQEKRSDREGLRIARSTTDDWFLKSAELLSPLHTLQRAEAFSEYVLKIDPTHLPVLAPGRGQVRVGQIWSCAGTEAGPDPPNLYFHFTETLGKTEALKLLGDRTGPIQLDAAPYFEEYCAREGVIEFGCWAHCRRRFEKSLKSHPTEAALALAIIRRMYKVEERAAELSAEQRLEMRQAHCVPLVDMLLGKAKDWELSALPQSPLGKALTYLRNQKAALLRYLNDGRVEIDNNLCERCNRYPALGRHNWLFAGSERGARAYAIHLTLVRNCVVRQVNPFEYYEDVLRHIPVIAKDDTEQLRALLPGHWSPGPGLTDRIVMPAMYSTTLPLGDSVDFSPID